MASKKMTFRLPEELAERQRELIRACEVANHDTDVTLIEEEFDALPDEAMET